MTSSSFDLGPMPDHRRVRTVDERVVRAPVGPIFDLARSVESWPGHLAHYRSVEMRDRRSDGGGVVRMAAVRPFGPLGWPVWWVAEMQIVTGPGSSPAVRFRHIAGVTRGMEVEWSFASMAGAAPRTVVRIVHAWDGPAWPLIGGVAASVVVAPVFVHGIASRTLAGLAAVAERGWAARERRDASRPHAPASDASIGAIG